MLSIDVFFYTRSYRDNVRYLCYPSEERHLFSAHLVSLCSSYDASLTPKNRGGFSESLWTLTGRIFAVLAVIGVIRNLVDGQNSFVDNVVRTKDIVVKIPIRPLHGFFKENVTAEPRLECIVNCANWIEIHRRGYTVYEFVSLATN